MTGSKESRVTRNDPYRVMGESSRWYRGTNCKAFAKRNARRIERRKGNMNLDKAIEA